MEKASIRKAVFLVGGMGTRFLPATKAVPKEMLPILDKPAIQYAVDEAVAAGRTQMIFVTNRSKRAIEDHFDADPALDRALEEAGKSVLREALREIIPAGIEFLFLRQGGALGTGHALRAALPAIGGEPVALFLPDDVFLGGSILPLVDAWRETGKTVLCTVDVAPEEVSKYGIVRPGATPGSVSGLVEKPAPGHAPSRRASVGRYILDPAIYPLLDAIKAGADGEFPLTDALNALAEVGGVIAAAHSGTRYDCGSKAGYLEAIVDFALARPDCRDRFLRFLETRTGAR